MKQYGEFPVLNDGKWTGEWKMQAIKVSATHWWPPSRTWAVAPATLKRDLRGRTLDDVFRDNRSHRGPWDTVPRCSARSAQPGTRAWGELLTDYEKHMQALRGPKWRPHPASVDPDHPLNRFRTRCPRHENAD